jgi:AraC-like DNA-binding protein
MSHPWHDRVPEVFDACSATPRPARRGPTPTAGVGAAVRALPTVVAFPFRSTELPTIRAELAGWADLCLCDDAEQLIRRVVVDRPIAVLLAVRERELGSAVPVIRRVRRESPDTPIVGYCELTYADLRGSVAAGSAGVDRIIVRGYDSARLVIEQSVVVADRRRVANAVLRELGPDVDEPLRWLIEYSVAHCREGVTVESAARAKDVSPGTLNNQLRRYRHPSPGRIISWCRLLVSADQLENPRRAVSHVAQEAGFATACELRMMLKRYTGLRPRDVRARGGLLFLAACCRRSLVGEHHAMAD